MALAARFVTSGFPFRATIVPRGAGRRTARNDWACAWSTYFVPASTCNAQRRRKSAAKTPSTIAPITATRTERRCVTRYGSTTRSGESAVGRRRRGGRVVVLAKELHLRRVIAAIERAQYAAHERVHGRRENQVEDDRGEQSSHHIAGRCAFTEDEVHDEHAERVEDGDHRHRRERSVAAITAGRLAVAADPVAGDGEQKRGEPELTERCGV